MRFKSVCKTMCYCWIHNMRLQNNYTFCICLTQLSLFIIPHSLYSSQCLSTAVGQWKMWACTPCFLDSLSKWERIFILIFNILHFISKFTSRTNIQNGTITACSALRTHWMFFNSIFLKLCKMRSLEAALVIRDAEAYFHPPFMSVQKRRFQWLCLFVFSSDSNINTYRELNPLINQMFQS